VQDPGCQGEPDYHACVVAELFDGQGEKGMEIVHGGCKRRKQTGGGGTWGKKSTWRKSYQKCQEDHRGTGGNRHRFPEVPRGNGKKTRVVW